MSSPQQKRDILAGQIKSAHPSMTHREATKKAEKAFEQADRQNKK